MARYAVLLSVCLLGAAASARSLGSRTLPDLGNAIGGIDGAVCSLVAAVTPALNYERSNYVYGVVSQDPFYSQLPENASTVQPGEPIKTERQTNTSLYTLPPTSALSRMIYQSVDINGSVVPVSSFVLWPYAPRRNPDGYQVVAWAHGTSGFTPDCAPSHIRNLWQHFLAPFMLSAQGYVVVGTDYAGLGVPKDAQGKPIVHRFLDSPGAANDVYYAVQAARKSFPFLSKNYVVAGHSQGGGAAWASAQRQAVHPADGYLGAVAISPVTNFLELTTAAVQLLGAATAPGIASIFPGFKTTDITTGTGQSILDQLAACGGCSAVADYLVGGITEAPLKPNWQQNPYLQQFQKDVVNGGKQIAGPLFVAHGIADPLLNFELTEAAVSQTLKQFPDSQIDFLKLPNVSHVPALQASQPTWMGWIADRFAGVPAGRSNVTGSYHARPVAALQPELNWYLGLATDLFETP